jgi:hypothetical protein
MDGGYEGGGARRMAQTDRVECGTHWYGRDCAYPSSGWKASAAQGVGTDISIPLRAVDGSNLLLNERGITHQATGGGVYGCTCISVGDVPACESNRW